MQTEAFTAPDELRLAHHGAELEQGSDEFALESWSIGDFQDLIGPASEL